MEYQPQENKDNDEAEAITMDTCLIDNEIIKYKFYRQSNFYFELYNPLTDLALTPKTANPNNKYLNSITSHFTYIGILSDLLTREIFGKNIYPNGDWYVGHWEKNKKDNIGIYSYNTNTPNQKEFYLGQWVQGKKQGKGIYIWKYSNNSGNSLNDCYYKALIGQFVNDTFDKGFSIEKSLNEKDNSIIYRLYEGTYDNDYKKHGKECILIENDQVFYGEFLNDIMNTGVITTFNKSNEIVSSFAFSTKNDHENDDTRFVFLPQGESKADNERRAINIISKVNQLQLFKNIEELYASLIPYESYFCEPQKFQIASFQFFSDPLTKYLTNTFTLKAAIYA